MYLLDTNAWVAYLRGKDLTLIARLSAHQTNELGLCTIVLGELYYGAYHSGAKHVAANLRLVEQLLRTFPIVGFDETAANEYGKLRELLGRTGQQIGPNDSLLASVALAHGLTLVTHNTAEFRRIPNLPIEDWQVP